LKHVVLVGNYAPSIINFRGALIDALLAQGHRVTACAPGASQEIIAKLRERGVGYEDLPLQRASINPVSELRLVASLVGIFRRIRPDTVLSYTVKPVVYASIASYLARVPQRASMITGVGYAFASSTLKARSIRRIQLALYKTGLRANHVIFFHNRDDRKAFTQLGLVPTHAQVAIVNGSGVDVDHYGFVPPPTGKPSFLLIARLLGDKGIREYVAAARWLRARKVDVSIQLLGPFDPNPAGIRRDELDAWVRDGLLTYLGETVDVRPFLAKASVFVLPSYHEGTPRSVLEAMATGRAIITTDVPGCRETVIDGENGFLVPVKNGERLGEAMLRFVVDPALVQSFGERSRRIAEDRYDARLVATAMIEALGLCASPRRSEQPPAPGNAAHEVESMTRPSNSA
jgi:glycosyltransferase involved in cell wall biosynthesis